MVPEIVSLNTPVVRSSEPLSVRFPVAPANFPVDAVTGPVALTTPGDFTGDGRDDLLARRTDGVLCLYPGNGRGGFGRVVTYGAGWARFTALVSPGDMTGDTRADLLARDTAGMLRLYRGNGRGGWSSGTVTIGGGWGALVIAGSSTQD